MTTKHKTGTREEWLSARLKLLTAEKEFTQRSDELAHAAGFRQIVKFQRSRFRHCALAWLRIRKRLQHSLQEGHGMLAAAIWPWCESAFACKRRGK
jgi:predicted dithiol-disulfide oxidoreductase (DUF899 family)